MLVGVSSDHECCLINTLLTHTDMTVGDEYTRVMNRLSDPLFKNTSLKSSLHQLRHSKTEDVIQFLFFVTEKAQVSQTFQEGVS